MPTDFSSLGIHQTWEPLHSGRLLVLGCARCVWDDLNAALGTGWESADVMAVNDAISYCPGQVDHAYSDHVEFLQAWARRSRWRPDLHTATPGAPEGVREWPWPRHGTSALGAVYTGLALGYDEIMLCGVPLDGTGHFYDPYWVGSPQFAGEERYWRNAAERIFGGRVRSMSGRTKAILG